MGVSNEFFLRRFGSFNPFYSVIVFLRFCGLSHIHAYTIFLSLYWWIGAIGFYILAKDICRHHHSALVAFLLLYFSALGNRLFDSYIVFVFVPMIWFFAFLVRFYLQQRSTYYLGMTLALMILATTYIPLYFGIILIVVGFLAALIFPRQLIEFSKRKINYQKKRWPVVLLCLLVLGCSLVPGIQMYQKSKSGDFVMPMRTHAVKEEEGHSLTVSQKTVTSWAILEELVYAYTYSDLQRFKFAVIYFPGFAFLLLVMGVFARMNRRLILYAVAMMVFFLMGTPGLTGMYDFFYQQFGVFKLFRNLHWFLWLGIIPLFVLFVVEIFDQWIEYFSDESKNKNFSLGWIIVAHGIFFWGIHQLNGVLISTYVSVLLSLIFWIGIVLSQKYRLGWMPGLYIVIMIVCQPIEVYGYLNQNSDPKKNEYRFDQDYDANVYQSLNLFRGGLYYAMKDYGKAYQSIDTNVFHQYVQSRFKLYDRVVIHSDVMDHLGWKKIEDIMARNLNIAMVHDGVSLTNTSKLLQAQEIQKDSEEFLIDQFSPNKIILNTNFAMDKFLVMSAAYDTQWHIIVNGVKGKIYKTNGAFQGIKIPRGKNHIEIYYNPKILWWNMFLCFIFYSMFLGISFGLWQNRKQEFDVS